MKDGFKKIGVIGLLVAFLLPFFEMPTVKAAEEDCKHYIQQYIFLATSDNGYLGSPDRWCNGKTGSSCTITSRNLGSYPYLFPTPLANETIRIDSVGEVNFNVTSNIRNYWDTYSNLLEKNNLSEGSYYWTGNYKNNKALSVVGGYEVFKYRNNISYYDSIVAIMHGKFANIDQNNEYIKSGTADWGEDINVDDEMSRTLQNIMKYDSVVNTYGLITFAGNRYGNINDIYTGRNFRSALEDVANDLNTAIDNNLVWTYGNNGNFLNIFIERNYSLKELNKLVYGYTDDSDHKKHYYTTDTTEDGGKYKIEDSYTAYFKHMCDQTYYDGTIKGYGEDECNKKYTEGTDFKVVSEDQVDSAPDIGIDTSGKTKYNIPAILNVEYSVCKTANNNVTPSENTWVLKYDKNTDDTSVTNMPDDQEARKGESITINPKAPSRKDYAFKGWCLDKDGSGTCYDPGDEIEAPTSTDTITLYASWGKTGSTDNSKTGVISYVIGFGSVGLIAGALYLIIKKKNLFKQI